jgi:hypothetical protein
MNITRRFLSISCAMVLVGVTATSPALAATKKGKSKAKSKPTNKVSTTIAAAKPAPGGPTTPESLLLAPNPAALAQQLQAVWGFPTWWPLPPSLDVTKDRPLTLQGVQVEEVVDDNKEVVTNRRHVTTYYFHNPDVDVAEKWAVGALAGAPFVLPASERTTGEKDGQKYVRLVFKAPSPPDTYFTRATVDVFQTGAKENVITGVAVKISAGTGTVPGRARAQVPALTTFNAMPEVPGALLKRTNASLAGGFFGGFSIVYNVTYGLPEANRAAAQSTLSNPANFGPEITLSGAPKVRENNWDQAIVWRGSKGAIAVFGDPGRDLLLTGKVVVSAR